MPATTTITATPRPSRRGVHVRARGTGAGSLAGARIGFSSILPGPLSGLTAIVRSSKAKVRRAKPTATTTTTQQRGPAHAPAPRARRASPRDYV